MIAAGKPAARTRPRARIARVTTALIAVLTLSALILPFRAAASQSGDDPLGDAYYEDHARSATARGFEYENEDTNIQITVMLVIFDDDKPAERFVDQVSAAAEEPDSEYPTEEVPLHLRGLPSREAEAVLYQTISDPNSSFDFGFASGGVRLDNVLLWCLAFGSGELADPIIPIFEAFIENAITANERKPATYLPAVSDLPAGYTLSGPDEQLYPEPADS